MCYNNYSKGEINKMVTRTITQVKAFSIVASGDILSGHGYCDCIPSITYAKDIYWESEEQCAQMLENAINEWEEQRRANPWGTTSHKPEIKIYWLTI
jgi:hypothetical protein